jgi:hypothetical protein
VRANWEFSEAKNYEQTPGTGGRPGLVESDGILREDVTDPRNSIRAIRK